MFYPPAVLLGTVKQDCCTCNWWTATDAKDKVVFYIEGPCCMPSTCCQDIKFDVLNDKLEHLGTIVKKFDKANVSEDVIDIFGARFELVLPLPHKVLLLGITFLIDFALFNSNDVTRSNEQVRVF